MQKTNAKGIKLIKEFEGLKLISYLCPSGVWTIGYGHTKGVKPKETITIAEAEGLLQVDLIEFEKVVNAIVKVPLTSNQFSALVCFAYNIGTSAFKNSTLLKLLNNCQFAEASKQFDRWVKGSNGSTLAGLVRRRKAEKQLFLS